MILRAIVLFTFKIYFETPFIFSRFPLFIFRCSFVKEFEILLNGPLKTFVGRPQPVWFDNIATVLKEMQCEG
jgi:hypothetical protein